MNRVLELKKEIEDEKSLVRVLQVMTDKEWYDTTPEWRRDVETRLGDIRIIQRSIMDMEAELRSFTNLPMGAY